VVRRIFMRRFKWYVRGKIWCISLVVIATIEPIKEIRNVKLDAARRAGKVFSETMKPWARGKNYTLKEWLEVKEKLDIARRMLDEAFCL
jgi:hypothetical protein